MLQATPGLRRALNEVHKNADLADELNTVFNIDLTIDSVARPFLKQHQDFISAADTIFHRFLHGAVQSIPYISAQRWVHKGQSRMNLNAGLNQVARAFAGDRKALQALQKYAPDLDLAAIGRRNADLITYTKQGKNAERLNLDAWNTKDAESILDLVLRIADDTILHGRIGEGSTFQRSMLGQILGQFRSYVSLSHNKILRGTIENEGYGAMAMLLAYQMPLTFAIVALNEARKGQLDLDNEDAMLDLAAKSLGYMSGLGFYADAWGILGMNGSRGGLSAPALSITQVPAKVLSTWDKDSDMSENVRNTAEASGEALLKSAPILGGFIGTSILLDSLKEDK
jgi:hypothetical protein